MSSLPLGSRSAESHQEKLTLLEFIKNHQPIAKRGIVRGLNMPVNKIEFMLKVLRNSGHIKLTGVSQAAKYTVTGKEVEVDLAEPATLPHVRVFRLLDRAPTPEMKAEMKERRKRQRRSAYIGSSMGMFDGF